jgi:hypothetical protein
MNSLNFSDADTWTAPAAGKKKRRKLKYYKEHGRKKVEN